MDSKKEDSTLTEVEEAKKSPELSEDENPFGFTKKQERRLLLKIDLNLLIILGLLYAFALIDRGNLANANVAGMGDDLHFEGTNRYSIISLIFFIPYILVELPCNMLIRKVNPRWVLATIGTLWGCVMIGMGFVTDWTQLVGLRILLGAFEGGFFPACAFLIQSWYKRREVQTRLAAFYLMSVLAAGLSKTLAYGLTTLEGQQGIRGWRWIFIVEGVLTVGIGLACIIFVQDFPDKKSRILSDRELEFIRYRIEKDRGDSKADSMHIKKLLTHLLDIKLWITALMFMCSTSATYALGYFLPIILRGMGFNVRDSQLLACPPYVFAVISAWCFSYISDKMFFRAPFIIIQTLFVITGVLMTCYAQSNAAKYVGTFLNCAGGQGLVPSILAYNANNIVSYSKRAASSALLVSFGAIGGIYATTVYREQDYPTYIPGTWAVVAGQITIIVCTVCMSLYYRRQNRLLDEGKLDKPIEGSPGFKYTY